MARSEVCIYTCSAWTFTRDSNELMDEVILMQRVGVYIMHDGLCANTFLKLIPIIVIIASRALTFIISVEGDRAK